VPSFSAADGTRLAYTEVGDGPPLLCLPGGPGRASVYLEDLGRLSDDRTLVRLDLRATGHSEVPADPTTLRFDRMADDVEALRVHLGLETVDVLGHSAGCLVAQAWASWYADAAEAQAALATAAPSQVQPLVRATRPFFYGRWDERTQAHAASAETQSSKRAELGFGAGTEDVDVDALLAGLKQVTAPVLVVGGERDALTGVDSVHAVAASFPAAQAAVLDRAGHFPWVDEPDALRTVVADFLRDSA
jgi:pimeloyl-ACP methyl ester carboxylesterase